MGIIRDLNRGVIDRFLVSPVSRVVLIAGRLIQLAVGTVVQSLILLSLGWLLGARYSGGIIGVTTLIISAILLATPISSLSLAMAITVRKEESVIGASNFILMPLTFLSPVFMANALMPSWIRAVSRFNPVNWSVEARREALQMHANWTIVLVRLASLAAFALVGAWLATRAFRSYQRSV
jgi:ABC-2 type transport system permease protein